MKVLHDLNDGVFDASTLDELEKAVREFLAVKGLAADVRTEGTSVAVVYPDVSDIDADEDERIVLNFCRNRRFGKARKVAKEWLARAPWNPLAHRILAQIEMECGDLTSAAAHIDDALRLDPKDVNALALDGNIRSLKHGSMAGGITRYRRAWELAPDSAITVNNYAGALMQAGEADVNELEALFRRAIELAPDYRNPYFALAQVLEGKGDKAGAFDVLQEGLMKGTPRPEDTMPLAEEMRRRLIELADELAKGNWWEVVEARRREIEERCGIGIDMVEDGGLGTESFAKSELAGQDGRTRHCVMYRPGIMNGCHAYHLMCQLEKLSIVLEERKAGRLRRFATGGDMTRAFVEKTTPYITDRFRASVPQGKLHDILAMMMKGMGNQLLNTPTDIIVAKLVFDRCPRMRPLQVTASLELAREGIGAVDVGVKSGMPRNLVRVSRVLNAVMLMEFKRIFGLDLVADLPLPDDEVKLVQALCEDCKGTMAAFRPGDEWNLIRRFLERLRCDSFYSIVDVPDGRSDKAFEAESNKMFNDRFTSGEDAALNESVTWYMVEAIRRLRKLDPTTVRIVAAEITVKGRRGIDPDKKAGYTLQSLGGEEMSGRQVLAYYYVAWRMTFPDNPEGTGLPFAREYEAALARAGGPEA